MSAIITDQFRILSAENFLASIASTENSYYSFVGLTNSTDYDSEWEKNPVSPVDCFDNYNDIWDTIVSLKRINSDDARLIVSKILWESGATYDMYRHDISRFNLSNNTKKTSLYESNFYVINSDYRVYICLNNGTDPENPEGRPSLDEPNFVDIEPRSAGNSGDGYVWKYLYTIKPSDVVKFDTENYIPLPKEWRTSSENAAVRDNANSESSGQLKMCVITNRGSGLGLPRTYKNVPIVGDGTGAEATIVVGVDASVESITITKGGQGYTYGVVDLKSGGISGNVLPTFDVIIPPPNGHGYDVYRELGGKNVLIYSRIESGSDFIIGNKIARVGIIKNPLFPGSSSLLSDLSVSNTYAIKLGGGFEDASFPPNSKIYQNVGVGVTAVGRVVSYDNTTGVLKYWQDRSLVGFNYGRSTLNTSDPEYGYSLNHFSSSGESLDIVGTASILPIDTVFKGDTINNIDLGQNFVSGISSSEVKKYSGEIIYFDNRPSITRSQNQKEDIKVILQF